MSKFISKSKAHTSAPVKKAIEDAEAVVEAVKEEDTVNVEMTADQKDEFVDFMAKKEERAKEEAEATAQQEEVVDMDLAYRHNIGKEVYGPGRAKVKREHAGLVQVGEQRRVRSELRLHSGSERLIKNLGILK